MRTVLIAALAAATTVACASPNRTERQTGMAEHNVTGGAYDSITANDTANGGSFTPTGDTASVANSSGNNSAEVPAATLLGQIEAADRMEIHTAELALNNAKSPAVKQLAQRLREDHQANLQKAQKLADSLHLNPIPPSNAAAHQTQVSDSLTSFSGASFDSAYVAHEIADHKEVIDRLQAASPSSPQTKAFVDDGTIPALKKHLDLAQKTQSKIKS